MNRNNCKDLVNTSANRKTLVGFSLHDGGCIKTKVHELRFLRRTYVCVVRGTIFNLHCEADRVTTNLPDFVYKAFCSFFCFDFDSS